MAFFTLMTTLAAASCSSPTGTPRQSQWVVHFNHRVTLPLCCFISISTLCCVSLSRPRWDPAAAAWWVSPRALSTRTAWLRWPAVGAVRWPYGSPRRSSTGTWWEPWLSADLWPAARALLHAAATLAFDDAAAHAKLGAWFNALISVMARVSS